MFLNLLSSFFFFMFIVNFFMFLYFNFFDISFFFEYLIMFKDLLNMNMLVFFDSCCFMFIMTVSLITMSVVMYCNYYMDNEKYLNRFMFLISLFVFSMYLLILSPNLISMLLGWDGLGLVSYLLVIYYQSNKSGNSGLLTVLSNRVGDVTLIMSISLSYGLYSWNYLNWDNVMYIISFLVIFTAFTKSAQLPFSAWLPAAMAAPTPVSSLVHSSTLVTAGIYFLIRFYMLLPSFMLNFIIFSGTMTMMSASMIAIFELDYKKIIALSTLSQLGLMMMILGKGMIYLCLFHLIIHALFKSSLFMCTGIIIHSSLSEQDKRLMYMNNLSSPWLMFSMGVNNMALFGFFYLSGFFSKDMILEFMLSNNMNFYLNCMIFFGTGCTLIYSINFIMTSSSNMGEMKFINFMNSFTKLNFISLIPLLIGSVFIGYYYNMYVYNDLFILDLTMFNKYLISLMILIIFFSSMNLNKVSKNLYNMFIYYKFSYSLLYLSSLSVFLKNFLNLNYLLLLDFKWMEYLVNMKINLNLYSVYTYIQMNLIMKKLNFFMILILLVLIMY